METLYIVMPAYNEEANIEQTVRSWYPKLSLASENSRLVIADAGSKDRTHEILLKLQEELPQLKIISNTNQFHGPKLIALYKLAIAEGATWIFQTDSDGQTAPSEFDGFWEQRDAFSGLFGHRVVRGDGKDRAFVESVVCILVRLFFNVRVPDANAPFRLMKSKIVEKYILRMEDDYNLPNIMLTVYFNYYKESTIFIPITFKPRQAGVNSINIPKIFKIGLIALKDFFKFRLNM